MTGLPILLAFATAYAGWAALALAMRRHRRQVWGDAPPGWAAPRVLRGIGTVLLAAAFAACVAESGWAIGPVAWFGVLTAAALIFVLLLASRPKLSVALAVSSAVAVVAVLADLGTA